MSCWWQRMLIICRVQWKKAEESCASALQLSRDSQHHRESLFMQHPHFHFWIKAYPKCKMNKPEQSLKCPSTVQLRWFKLLVSGRNIHSLQQLFLTWMKVTQLYKNIIICGWNPLSSPHHINWIIFLSVIFLNPLMVGWFSP